MSLTTDPNDPRLTHGPDPDDGQWRDQAETMGLALAETFAANPSYYGNTYCAHCGQHRPVGENGEFYWCDQDNDETMAPARQPKVGT